MNTNSILKEHKKEKIKRDTGISGFDSEGLK
jgi:hypothetical protein